MELEKAGIIEVREAVAARKISAEEVVRDSLERIEEHNPRLNAFLEVFPEQSIQAARDIDARLARGDDVGPLAGVTMAIKDNMCLSWGKTTCGCRMLADYRSPFTATAVQRLIDAGAIIVGKTNLDEFAMGGSGEHSAFGPTRNPHDETRVPGGSSSGSAAAVAAGLVTCALGSDTGGSIRQPAGFCGIVGLKPTYGRVSRYGLVAFASSLDQIGPLARGVHDAAEVLKVISGRDENDSTCADLPVCDCVSFDRDIAGMKVGVPRRARSEKNSPGVNAAMDRAVAALMEMGAEIVEIDLPHIDAGIAAYYIIAPAEASSNLARFDGVRYGRRATLEPGEGLEELYSKSRAEGFGAEVQRRIMLGTHVLSSGYYDAYYVTALKVRRLIKQDYDQAFAKGCRVVLMPSSPGPAWKIGAKGDDPLAMYLEDVYTVGVNLAGLPGITIPGGFEVVKDGAREVKLPIGVQLVGPALEERRLLGFAAALERALGAGT